MAMLCVKLMRQNIIQLCGSRDNTHAKHINTTFSYDELMTMCGKKCSFAALSLCNGFSLIKAKLNFSWDYNKLSHS